MLKTTGMNQSKCKKIFSSIVHLFIAAFFSTVLSGCYFFPKEEEVLAPPIKVPDEVTYETVEVKRGTIENTIRVSGSFVAVSQKDLFFEDRGGRLKDVYVVLGQSVKKGDVLAMIDTEGIENDIKLQELAVQRAQLVYEDAKARYEIEGGSDTDLEMARLDYESNQLKLENLKTELQKAKLVSPINGQVVYVTNAKLGEYIDAYQTVVRVADPTQLQLRYSQDKINSFSLGQKATVKIDDKEYEAEVTMTPAEAPGDADDQTKKSVFLKVENIPDTVKIGKNATISLTLEKQENVIVIPKQLINNFANRKFVNVLKDNIREERDIEVGIQNDTEAEVIKGLEEGELIIVS
jgi:macrolide-specific efflux system membrane fusion protein